MINKNIYAAATSISFGPAGGVFVQTNGVGAFNVINPIPSGECYGVMAANNGDVYAFSTYSITVQTGGVGEFIDVPGTENINWYGGGASLRNGDIYACSASEHKVYLRAGGVGPFVAIDGFSEYEFYYDMSVNAAGDVYLAATNGMHRKLYGEDWELLDATPRTWMGVTCTPWGDVYATCGNVGSLNIYKQTAGVGDFISLNQTSRYWNGVTCGPDGNVYAAVGNGDIYKQTGGVGDFTPLSQELRAWHGMGAGSLNAYSPRSYGTIIG